MKAFELLGSTHSFMHDVARQAAISAGLVAATIALKATAAPIDGVERPKGWAIAVDLWPGVGLASEKEQPGVPLALALLGATVAVGATAPALNSWLRWPLVGLASADFGALVTIDVVRRVKRRRGSVPNTASPNSAILWGTAPLTVSAVGTAVVLGIRSSPGGLSGGKLAELLFVTALGEEFIFRGCLLMCAYRVLRPPVAEIVTALSFGAWHIADAWIKARHATTAARTIEIAATVLVTATGGLIFSFVRRRSHGLVGSVLAHVATNLPGVALR